MGTLAVRSSVDANARAGVSLIRSKARSCRPTQSFQDPSSMGPPYQVQARTTAWGRKASHIGGVGAAPARIGSPFMARRMARSLVSAARYLRGCLLGGAVREFPSNRRRIGLHEPLRASWTDPSTRGLSKLMSNGSSLRPSPLGDIEVMDEPSNQKRCRVRELIEAAGYVRLDGKALPRWMFTPPRPRRSASRVRFARGTPRLARRSGIVPNPTSTARASRAHTRPPRA